MIIKSEENQGIVDFEEGETDRLFYKMVVKSGKYGRMVIEIVVNTAVVPYLRGIIKTAPKLRCFFYTLRLI